MLLWNFQRIGADLLHLAIEPSAVSLHFTFQNFSFVEPVVNQRYWIVSVCFGISLRFLVNDFFVSFFRNARHKKWLQWRHFHNVIYEILVIRQRINHHRISNNPFGYRIILLRFDSNNAKHQNR